MISQIDDEIVALKSLRDGTNQSKESNTISIANNRSEVFQNQIIQLFEYKQTMERNMMMFEPISFLTEFPVYTTPKGRTSFRLVLLGFVFLLFGCFLAFVKELKKMGSGADVVSGGELLKVIKAGISNKKIVFSGIGKTEDEIKMAIKKKLLWINVKSKGKASLIKK